MSRYSGPPPEPRLPLIEYILCGIVVAIVAAGLIYALITDSQA